MAWFKYFSVVIASIATLGCGATVGTRDLLRSSDEAERTAVRLVREKTGEKTSSSVVYRAKNERPGGCDQYFAFCYDEEANLIAWLAVPSFRDSAARILPDPLRPFSLSFFEESIVRNHITDMFGKRVAIVTLDLVVPRLPCGMYDRPYWHIIMSSGRDYYLDPFGEEVLDGEAFRKKICEDMRDANGLRFGGAP